MLKPHPQTAWWRQLSRYQWWVLFVATLGWLFDSMDQRLFVLARTPALKELIPGASDAQVLQYSGYATSVFIVGWATGGLLFGLLGDRWGRTRTMMATILMYSLFTGLSGLAVHWWDFAAYRFLSGMGIGGEYAAGVALIAEVMPDGARAYCLGLLQSLAALGHVAGSAISLFIGPQVELHGVAGWRWLFGIGVLPALLVVGIRSSVREPDAWLTARGRENGEKQLGNVQEIFRNRVLRKHVIIGMTLGMAGQIGLWGIGYWTPELIRSVIRNEATANGSLAVQSGSERVIQAATQDRVVAQGTLLQDLGGMIGVYCAAILATWLGRRAAFAIAFLGALVAAVATFGTLNSGAQVYWMAPVLGFAVSSVYGCFAVYFPELFPTGLRSTGVGFCYNVARYITALGPLALGQLIIVYATLGYSLPIRPAAITIAAIYLVGLAALAFAPETKGKPLPV